MAGAGPQFDQAMNAATATSTTAGTKYPATRSASFWIGARLRCASATISTICESMVSAPTRLASTTSVPVPLIVAPVTGSPTAFSTGTGSPVSIDSSIDEWPSTTTPSTGALSPGRIRRRSPTLTLSSGISSSRPSGRMIRAVFGARSKSARIASPVRSRARSSSSWPSNTRITMTAAAS